jgi:hypothetical protein
VDFLQSTDKIILGRGGCRTRFYVEKELKKSGQVKALFNVSLLLPSSKPLM